MPCWPPRVDPIRDAPRASKPVPVQRWAEPTTGGSHPKVSPVRGRVPIRLTASVHPPTYGENLIQDRSAPKRADRRHIGQHSGMEADELLEFLETRMRMSHVYQPLLIRCLLDAGGQATVRQLAIEFSKEDEAQVRYYEDRIKKMPVDVLKGHGVVEEADGVVKLIVDGLTFEEKANLRAICEQKIGEFLSSRGLSTWDYSLLSFDPVGESLRYEILTRDRVCQLCGATREQERLEVDHIVPRSKGGTNDPGNLQVLCAPCNRGKSNRDDTDFRN